MTDVSKSMSRDQQLAATLSAIEATGPTDIQVYTDGSTHEGTTDGGAGMVVMSGEDIIERWNAPTGRWSSSCQAEKSAMVRAISMARCVRGLAIGAGALQLVPGRNPCEL